MTDALDLVWGRRPVQEALKRGIVRKIFLEHSQPVSGILAEIVEAASDAGILIERASEQQLGLWAAGERTQGIAAQVDPPTTINLTASLAATTRAETPPFYLVLDQVQDPHNFGALLRTANAAGVDAVIIPERRSASLTGTVAKVSAGAVHHVTLVEVKNLRRALDQLREHNIWIVGLEESARQSVYDVDLTVAIALVLGNEGEGMRSLTRQACDFLVHLPMLGAVGSLNVSVAGAIAMYELGRQRRPAHPSIG